MCSTQNAIDDVEIAGADFGDHELEKIRPSFGKVFAPDDRDRIGKLTLNLF